MGLIEETKMLRYLYPKRKDELRFRKHLRNYEHVKLAPWMCKIIEETIKDIIKESED